MTATSTGRRGYVGIDRRWLNNPDLTDSALRLMLWLDSHSDEYLAALNISRSADELGWSRNRVKRAMSQLEDLGLITTAQLPRQYGGTVTRITLHLEVWSGGSPRTTDKQTDGPRQTSAVVHDEARAVVHDEAPTTSTPSSRNELLENVPAIVNYQGVSGLCEQLAQSIAQRRTGNQQPAVTDAWLSDMDKLIRLDQRTPDEIRAVIAWLAKNGDEVSQFWSPNIRTPHKLRAKWDTMAEQYERLKPSGPGGYSIMDRIANATAKATA